jgi:hypothetical protein
VNVSVRADGFGDGLGLGVGDGVGDGAPPTPPPGAELNRYRPPIATATTATAARAKREKPFIVWFLHGSQNRRRV